MEPPPELFSPAINYKMQKYAEEDEAPSRAVFP